MYIWPTLSEKNCYKSFRTESCVCLFDSSIFHDFLSGTFLGLEVSAVRK